VSQDLVPALETRAVVQLAGSVPRRHRGLNLRRLKRRRALPRIRALPPKRYPNRWQTIALKTAGSSKTRQPAPHTRSYVLSRVPGLDFSQLKAKTASLPLRRPLSIHRPSHHIKLHLVSWWSWSSWCRAEVRLRRDILLFSALKLHFKKK